MQKGGKAMREAWHEFKNFFRKGDIVLLVTFGAGLTWSSAAIRLW